MFWRRKRREQDLEREVRSDLELEAEEQQERGLSPEEARYAARRAFGNTTLVKEEVREVWGWIWFERRMQDLRYAIRALRNAPAFTTVAVLSLALGIGASTTVFSILNSVLLKRFPYENQDKLIVIESVEASGRTAGVSPANFLDWQKLAVSRPSGSL